MCVDRRLSVGWAARREAFHVRHGSRVVYSGLGFNSVFLRSTQAQPVVVQPWTRAPGELVHFRRSKDAVEVVVNMVVSSGQVPRILVMLVITCW